MPSQKKLSSYDCIHIMLFLVDNGTLPPSLMEGEDGKQEINLEWPKVQNSNAKFCAKGFYGL
jgi:hypothetical protein